MKLTGRITISRTSGNREMIVIGITDWDSMAKFVEAEMTLEDFARCVTGHHSPCELEVRQLEQVGKEIQSKTEYVLLSPQATPASIRLAVQAYEVDGWIGNDSDAKNHHHYIPTKNRDDKHCYAVGYRRWVEKETS